MATTGTALQNAGSTDNAKRFAGLAATRADKTVRPASALKIGSTRPVIGKQLLKLGQRLGKNQIVTLEDVYGRHGGQGYM